MKTRQPRHPIVIIGAGIAGLSAAHTLDRLGLPAVILERFDRAGGRLNSRLGEGWTADHGTPYVHTRDEIICELIRSLGLETSRVVVQGSIRRLTPNYEIITPPGGGIDISRVAIAEGFASFANRLAARFDIRYHTPIGALRWDNSHKTFWWEREGQVFWFEDEEGEPWRDAITHKVLMGSGVILSTTGTAAARIARRSRSLEGLVPVLESIKYSTTYSTMFRVPRQRLPWYGLRGEEGCPFIWVALEEQKSPDRVPPDESLVVVHCASKWSVELMRMDRLEALRAVYQELRKVIPTLPPEPITQTYKRWNVSKLISEPLGPPAAQPEGRWPSRPPHAPFALAGDYIHGSTAEDAARSGREAALHLAAQLPERHTFLGLELAN